MAAEKIENIYAQSPFVAQCFVYGDSLKSAIVGIVVPDEEYLAEWSKSQPALAGKDFKAMVADPAVKKAVVASMATAAAAGGLHGFEKVKAVHLHDEQFSAENDLLTPTFKLKRNVARDRFAAEIDTLYAGKIGDVAGQAVKQAEGAGAASAGGGN